MMEPITLILAALAAGATASVKDVTNQAISDAYAELKTFIKRKIVGKPATEAALDQYERNPDIWKAPLEDSLKEIGVEQDSDILAAAQHLMALTQSQQVGMGKYTIQNTGTVQGQIIGDNAQVTQHFGDYSKG